MCGITGFYSENNRFYITELKRITALLTHRGPDDVGFFTDEIAGLGSRRLRIIDLSKDANQPMYSHNGRYIMVYNGEVYNYSEIALELKQKYGTNFRTASDSEVILEAFAYYGD